MAIDFKDYYQILGVGKSASDDEIRKAFRKLARVYHPDVAGNKPHAEDKFKEINEAYEVLSDPVKRKKYDELGSAWNGGGGFRPPPGWESFERGRPGSRGAAGPEFQFNGTGFSDFFEQLFGSMRGASTASGPQRFPRAEDVDDLATRRGNDVQADLMVTIEEANRGSVRSVSLRRMALCEKCFGAGRVNQHACLECHGRGEIERTDTYKVKVPVGVRAGQRLRIAGQGEPGAGGGSAGDLFLRVQFAKHPDFRVEGDHLYHDLHLAPWEAVLGANVPVPTLNGTLSIRIPPGTQGGQKLRLKGKGLALKEGGSGDLHVVTHVDLPGKVEGEEKELWEKLAKESRFSARE